MKKYMILVVLLVLTQLVIVSAAAEAPGVEWEKSLGGSLLDEAYSIAQTSDGGYSVTGWTSSNDGDVSGNHGSGDYWVVKLESDGPVTSTSTLTPTLPSPGLGALVTLIGIGAVAVLVLRRH